MLTVNNISKKYNTVQALSNVSFNVGKGEIFGLIGPDGAGKTTLFRILTTLILADSGTANLNGWDVVKDYLKIRNNAGYMPGRFSLYQNMTVEENLEFFATLFHTSISENYDLVKDIYSQIEPFKNRMAGKLSGGMKQKLALSCALIHRPLALFLDEPTTGIDPVSRKELWAMLRGLKSQGITIVVSTPYMDEAMLCDRIAFIQQGKILTINTPEKIIAAFPHRIYSVETNDIYLTLNKLRQNPAIRSVFSFGDALHVIFENGKLNKDENNSQLSTLNLQFKEIMPTIEDCFMEMSEQ
ncbi:MAG: ABC transporter ATP-binding protein [Dysgonamonadaceae bacterium]|jgi:ABC-type multidrug transport system ATPase subunit|nr:ABC transporter ATP-binding protein [Dysgonamonadaceae bacterium]